MRPAPAITRNRFAAIPSTPYWVSERERLQMVRGDCPASYRMAGTPPAFAPDLPAIHGGTPPYGGTHGDRSGASPTPPRTGPPTSRADGKGQRAVHTHGPGPRPTTARTAPGGPPSLRASRAGGSRQHAMSTMACAVPTVRRALSSSWRSSPRTGAGRHERPGLPATPDSLRRAHAPDVSRGSPVPRRAGAASLCPSRPRCRAPRPRSSPPPASPAPTAGLLTPSHLGLESQVARGPRI